MCRQKRDEAVLSCLQLVGAILDSQETDPEDTALPKGWSSGEV